LRVTIPYISGSNLINPKVSADPMRPLCDVGVEGHAFIKQALHRDLQQIVSI